MHIGRTLPPKAGQHLTVAKMTWTCNRPSNLLCWKLEGKTLRPRVTVSESTTICGLLLAFVLSFSSWTEKKNPILIGVTPSKVNYISVKKKRKKERTTQLVRTKTRKKNKNGDVSAFLHRCEWQWEVIGTHGSWRPHTAPVEWRDNVDLKKLMMVSAPSQVYRRVQRSIPFISLIYPCSRVLKLCKLFSTFFCYGNTDLLFFVVVKVAGVPWASALWYERGFHLQQWEQNIM